MQAALPEPPSVTGERVPEGASANTQRPAS